MGNLSVPTITALMASTAIDEATSPQRAAHPAAHDQQCRAAQVVLAQLVQLRVGVAVETHHHVGVLVVLAHLPDVGTPVKSTETVGGIYCSSLRS